MKRKRETLQEFVDRVVPCRTRYWTPEARRLADAAKAGMCVMTIEEMPWWRFEKKPPTPDARMGA